MSGAGSSHVGGLYGDQEDHVMLPKGVPLLAHVHPVEVGQVKAHLGENLGANDKSTMTTGSEHMSLRGKGQSTLTAAKRTSTLWGKGQPNAFILALDRDSIVYSNDTAAFFFSHLFRDTSR